MINFNLQLKCRDINSQFSERGSPNGNWYLNICTRRIFPHWWFLNNAENDDISVATWTHCGAASSWHLYHLLMEICSIIIKFFRSNGNWQVAADIHEMKKFSQLKMIMQILNPTMIWEINSSSFAFRSHPQFFPCQLSANVVMESENWCFWWNGFLCWFVLIMFGFSTDVNNSYMTLVSSVRS